MPRYVLGVSIEHVLGDPALGKGEEYRLRRRTVERALELLTLDVARARSPSLIA